MGKLFDSVDGCVTVPNPSFKPEYADDMPWEEREKSEFYALDAAGCVYSPSWVTFNVRASYKVTDILVLNATVENIGDRRYRPYSCGISAPGRNFTLNLRLFAL